MEKKILKISKLPHVTPSYLLVADYKDLLLCRVKLNECLKDTHSSVDKG